MSLLFNQILAEWRRRCKLFGGGLDIKARAGEIRFALPKEIGVMSGDSKRGWTVAVEEGKLREHLKSA